MSAENKNIQAEDLTIEKLRTFEGFETVSEAEAENIIRTIKQFTIIAYDCFQKKIQTELINKEAA